MVICPTHGLTGAAIVCRETAERMESTVEFRTTTVCIDDLLLPSAPLCDRCLADWNDSTTDEQREAFLDRLVPVCGRHWKEALDRLSKQ
jgi:hypothetical protein